MRWATCRGCYGREVRCVESEGLDAIIRGMQLALPDDEALIQHSGAVFDGLRAYLGREVL